MITLSKTYYTKQLVAVFLIYACLFDSFASTDSNEYTLSNNLSQKEIVHYTTINSFPIKAELSSLMELLKQPENTDEIIALLDQQTLVSAEFNAAELYLFLVAKALVITTLPKVHSINLDNENAVSLLIEADKLSIHISDKQLLQPEFLQLHLILAKQYSQQGKYDLAYLQQSSYLEKYHLYRNEKRKLLIDSVEKSFEVDNKKANNDLLRSQNELKNRRVVEAKDETASQQYNFSIVISIAMLFVLLFFRQLKIRNKLIKMTLTDPLTKVANRSALFGKGNLLVENYAKEPYHLSVLLLDLDHFKRINDNFGHHIGDKILIIISELIMETMRSRDFFARLGGEEFVALLPYADTHKAKAIAMRIHEKVAAYDFSSIMLQKKMTISIGIATMVSDKMSFDDLLHCADLAMYQAKDKGRNTVVCYDQISVSQERRTNTHSS